MLHQHPQELWGSITSSCFSAFHFFLRSEGREDQRSVPISPKNLSQIHKFVLPFTSISHGTWWLNTHCCGYRCHSSIARCCTQTNPFDCSRHQFPKIIQDKKTSYIFCVCQRGWVSSPLCPPVWRPVQCTGRQVHPRSILCGRTRAAGGYSISFQCLFFFFFSPERGKLIGQGFCSRKLWLLNG